MNLALIIGGLVLAAVLAFIAGWCSVARKKIDSGGTFTFTLWACRWVVPAPAAEVALPAEAEQPAADRRWAS